MAIGRLLISFVTVKIGLLGRHRNIFLVAVLVTVMAKHYSFNAVKVLLRSSGMVEALGL